MSFLYVGSAGWCLLVRTGDILTGKHIVILGECDLSINNYQPEEDESRPTRDHRNVAMLL